MTDSKKIYFYIAANLAFLIPIPGRFAYALIMLIIFNVQMATVTLLFHAVHRLHLASMRNSLLTLTIIALSVFYKQLLTVFCPLASITLGYCIFLPALASVIIDFFFLDYEHGVRNHLVANMKHAAFMSVFALVFFLIRDLFGYGTLTLPAWKHILVFRLPYNPSSTSASVFLATIPGSLCLIVGMLAVYIFIMRKFSIMARSPAASHEKVGEEN